MNAKLKPPRATPEGWKKFAAGMTRQALEGYADGDLDLREALRWVAVCSRNCAEGVQIGLLGIAARDLLKIKPPDRPRGRRRPIYPKCFERSAANLVMMFEEDGEIVTTGSGAIEHAIAWLDDLNLYPSPTKKTLGKWYQDQRRAKGEQRGRGRPKR